MRKYGKKALSLLLCLLLVTSVFFEMPTLESAAAGGNAISNPEPVIDIVVNVPADYEGTFLDFKEELTQKLVAEGMDPSTFRIVSGAIKIDTTDTSTWYVYDHYRSSSIYNSLGVDSTLQPDRGVYDNTYTNGSDPFYIRNWESQSASEKVKCKNFDRHIYSTVDVDNKAKMIFVGYGTQALTDYMIYPAASNSRRTFSFDIDGSGIGNHTLTGAGFFVNAGIQNGNLTGYLLFYQFTSITSTDVSGTLSIKKFTGTNARNVNTSVITSASNIKSASFSLGSLKKARIDVDLRADSITAQQRNYQSGGTFGSVQTLFGGKVTLDRTGFNGFGPMAAYTSHGCQELSSFIFSDLEMTYEADAFETLQSVAYAESANQRYFINLTGSNNDPAIPTTESAYVEGITRLVANEVFYICPIDDGRVLSTPDGAGNIGVTPANGLYATDGDFVSQIAQYIHENYVNEVEYTPVDLGRKPDYPISMFNLITRDAENNESQVLTVHLNHFQGSNALNIYINDKSIRSKTNNPITQYKLVVYDPDNRIVKNEGFTTYSSLTPFQLNNTSKQGKYTFELTVKDSGGLESNPAQTYITTYMDNTPGTIAIEGQGKQSKAKITLTDRGYGIDEDGVTLIEGEGSGVYSYQVDSGAVTNLPAPIHEYEFDIPLTQGKEYTIKSWDECGNEATNSFLSCKVSFEDDLADTYYVVSGAKLGELPPAVPHPTDPDMNFKCWSADASNAPVSSETVVSSNMVLHPVYTSAVRWITFNANGGQFSDETTTKQVKVADGSNIIDAILTGDDLPEKEGYDFTKWTLNGADISTQTANADNIVIMANWSVASFTLKFDPNTGTAGNLKEKEVPYGTLIKNAIKAPSGNDYAGRDLPTREGYFFRGWAIDAAGTAIPNDLTMPAATYSVYAKWERDLTKYILMYDSAGGSSINNKSRVRAEHPNFTADDLPTPNRQGYTFDCWYFEDSPVSVGDSIPSEVDITLTAHWIPKSDTPYSIQSYFYNGSDYYINRDFTRSLTGTTEEVITIDPEAYYSKTLAELGYAFDGVDSSTTLEDYLYSGDYWFDEDNENNVLSKAITGDGRMVLKLYHKRYFKITTQSKGSGSITTFSKNQKEGSSPVVIWEADEGNYAKRIVVDGILRDDLLSTDNVIFNNITADHDVYVEFESGSSPVPKSYYNINTTIDGIDGSAAITESTSVPSGSDFTVSWHENPGYYITKVSVDGMEYDVDTTSIDFSGIGSDHSVIVTTKRIPHNGGNTTKGFYTVTVNCYNANRYITGKSETFDEGDDCLIDWSDLRGDRILSYYFVDGELEYLDDDVEDEITADDTYTFNSISANHVIDLYFTGGSGYSNSSEYVTVSTRIGSGLGSISGKTTVDIGEDHTVEFEPKRSSASVDSDDYYAYRLAGISIDGEEQAITPGQTSITLENLQEDKNVVVFFETDIYNVSVLGYGNGTVSASQTKYAGQSYELSAQPDTGYELTKLVIDDEEVALSASDKQGYTTTLNNINSDHTIKAYFVEVGEVLDEEDLISVKVSLSGFTGQVLEGVGLFERGTRVVVKVKLDDGFIVDEIYVNGEKADYTPSRLQQMSFTRSMSLFRRLAYSATEEDGVYSVDLGEVEQDMEITFSGGKDSIEGDDELPETPPDDPETYTVTTDLKGGPGTITGGAQIEEGNDYTVSWSISDPNYETRAVIIDGENHPELVTDSLTGNYTFSNINEDHDIEVVIGEKPTTNIDVDGDGTPDVNIDTDGDGIPDVNVDTDGDGIPDVNIDTDNTGTWKPTSEGGNADGIWKPDTNLDTDGDGTPDITSGKRPAYDNDGDGVDDNWNPSKEVYPNGISGKPYETGNPVVDVDVDGDGKPDYNVDTDGDGIPDVNIDTDGDGTPDVNVDTDNTGEWKPSGEGGNADGIWKPDTNLDTNGDGVVDTPKAFRDAYDNDGDGVDDSWKPDKEVHPDTGNDVPYKTDDPRVNIDTDGDGEPDVNVDTDGDGEPDVNVDMDGDGTPDLNVDTDGDGTPDVNVDTDGDGTPDMNIDTDGDGDPDLNIDTDGDGTPDVNIDTDGDGEPDLNVDTDGDGKPDVDTDTDDDGKPDVNIDTDDDKKPDVNIDTDDDGKPDVNVDTDSDGKPDKNIDRDGDGKADLDTPVTGDSVLILVIALAVFVELFAGTIIWTYKKNGYSRLKMKK